ncbi:hypothetical protein [uncultured Intestinimonas sp.]|uniref:hypothetical protein n=1 Tax=uncultured Intestinimonas sp. TaxID=1689265 RepID=UPI0029437A63|nr:hypothetical protein [uncultured Intestinimonas sp.]
MSLLLLAVCIISLCLGLLYTRRIHRLEAEEQALQGVFAQVAAGRPPEREVLDQAVTRLPELQGELYGGRLSKNQGRCFFTAGLSGFALLCLQVERFKSWAHGRDKDG